MSTSNPNRPPKRNSTLSLSLVVVAVAVFVLTRWSNGGLAGLLGGPTAAPAVSTATVASQQAGAEEAIESDDTAEVQAGATTAPIETPEEPSTSSAQSTDTPEATPIPTPTANAPPYEPVSDLPTIAYDDLPPEAHDTIALIEQDGPFPFSRDCVTFQNRERILPRQPEGYYQEYTVITPGESDRGARRIVAGEDGEMYYTDDHYESFSEIIPE